MLPLYLLGAVLLRLAYLPLEEHRPDSSAIRELSDEYRILRLLSKGDRLHFFRVALLRAYLGGTRLNLSP
jgi:hypothetical protein